MKLRRLAIVLVALSTVAILSACGGGEAPAAPSNQQPATAPTTPAAPTLSEADLVAKGDGKFVQNCSACHSEDARGIEGLGKDLVGTEFVTGSSDAELVGFIKVGRGSGDPANTTGIDMPAKGGNPALSNDDMEAIVAFIRSLQ